MSPTELERIHARYVERSEGLYGWDYRGWREIVEAYGRGVRPALGESEYDRASLDGTRARKEYAQTHSWAVPTDRAIALITEHSPNGLVDMGAGSGYWAHLLDQAGVYVRAFDKAPGQNHWTDVERPWHPVDQGTPEVLRDLDLGTLLLVWPPYDDSMASESLRHFTGHTVVYVGEIGGGCTADDAFHETLERDWTEIESCAIPQWPGLHDSLAIYRRGATSTAA